MKLDKDYLRLLMLKIEAIQSPRPSLEEIVKSMGVNAIDDNFLLHYEMLRDYGFIEGVDDPHNIGIIDSMDGIDWFDADIRITAKGHEFASALNQNEVWEILKEKFKENSIDTVFSIATEIVKNTALKKLEKIIGSI